MVEPGKVQAGEAERSAPAARPVRAAPDMPLFTRPPADVPASLSRDVLWVPSECLHLASLSLPLARPAARLQSLPFAFEPLLVQPIESVHVALGPAQGDGQYLAAAIDRVRMEAYTTGIGKAARLVPDVMMLPVPPPGTWTIGEISGRVLVRTPDGAGFAVTRPGFADFLGAAGHPVCQLAFGSVSGLHDLRPMPAGTWPDQSGLLDLRQGSFLPGSIEQADRTMRQTQLMAAVVVIFTGALIAEAVLAAAAADQRREALVASFSDKYAALAAGPDVVETIEALAARTADADRGGFIGVLSGAAAALEADGGLALRRAEFDDSEARLDLAVEAGSPEGLYDYARRLEQGGLSANVSDVRSLPGGAEGLVSVPMAGAGGAP